jgi:hypothetical protein
VYQEEKLRASRGQYNVTVALQPLQGGAKGQSTAKKIDNVPKCKDFCLHWLSTIAPIALRTSRLSQQRTRRRSSVAPTAEI